MEIKKNEIDSLNAQLTLSVSADDYSEKRKKLLNDYRRKADIKGFRKGMAPASLIERIYGHSALVDSVNGIISESLNNYINENKLNIFGEPLPAENQPENDWTAGKDFEFVFDIAFYPDINFEIGEEDVIPYYTIKASDEACKDMKDNMLKQFGNLVDGEAAGEEDFVIADIEQGETKIEGTYVSLKNIAEECRGSFIGLKPEESVEADVTKAFPNENDRATMLKVKVEELAGLEPVWKFTVKSVKTFKAAELCRDTYDKIFGPGNVNSEEEFDAKVAERLAAEYERESEYRFAADTKKYLLDKAQVELPSAFMKRWLVAANEGKYTTEQVEQEFDGFADDFKWQCIKDYIARKFDVKVEQEDLRQGARELAAYQFAMYGMYDVPQEHLDQYADRILANENEGRRVMDQVEEEKVLKALKEKVTLDRKEVSQDEFRALGAPDAPAK